MTDTIEGPRPDAPVGFAFDEPPAGRGGMVGYLLDTLRHRPLGRVAMTALTTLLFVSGAGMFAYPFFTDVYTTQVIQTREAEEFARISLDVQTFDEWETTIANGGQGTALTKIVIPEIGVTTLVVEGTSASALRAGAGHYPETPLPGQAGNVAIAGHRTTYGRPFNRLDELDPGDQVWLATPVGDYLYEVSTAPVGWGANPFVTDPGNWSVVQDTLGSQLTLTTCHPKGSARQRLILRAHLVESHPAGYYDAQAAADL